MKKTHPSQLKEKWRADARNYAAELWKTTGS
jgi:hypothetical protein